MVEWKNWSRKPVCQGGWGWAQEASERAEQEQQEATNANLESEPGSADRQKHREGATARAGTCAVARANGRILDEHMAKWLRAVLEWKGDNDVLDVLRDEVTAALEAEAFAQPIESSGTWDPEQLTNRKTENPNKEGTSISTSVPGGSGERRSDRASAASRRQKTCAGGRSVLHNARIREDLPDRDRGLLGV